MSMRIAIAGLAIVVTAGSIGAVRIEGQAKTEWKARPEAKASAGAAKAIPRTADGRPDLHGTWNSIDAFFIPLERPSKLQGDARLSADEINEVLREEAQKKIDGALTVGVGSYDREWYEYRDGQIGSRSSLVVDPPDGRIPAMTQWGKDKVAFVRAHATDSHEFIDPGDRCITRGILGMMLPTFYNNGKQIVQTRAFVTIASEMIHDARIVPLDSRPQPPASHQAWTGIPRGRWEGDTLVVESTNFAPRDVLRGIRVQSEQLKMTERFTLVDADTLIYRATIDDPKVYTQPWTIEFPFKRDNQYQMFEYACHEGNHAVEGILGGARFGERNGTATPR